MKIDIQVESKIANTSRVRQLSAMFDVPPSESSKLEWKGEFPIEQQPWNVGLIVGPSGSGKSTVARQLFGDAYEPPINWNPGSAVIDDFQKGLKIEEISNVCQAVGFNTIPAWMRPYHVLSNGERFRVELARRLLELPDPIIVDEFTSVVDRQVAQIGSHAVQKYVRKNKRKFVAISCHFDIIDWLQPDWIFQPGTMNFARRALCRRPALDITISRVPYSAWSMFAPFHYLTADLHRNARCFCLFVGDRPASFAAMLHRPHPTVRDIMGLSRLVTLPDWQGLGLAMVLSDKLGSAYKAIGKRMHTYPAHPALIRSYDHSPNWAMEKMGGQYNSPSKYRLAVLRGETPTRTSRASDMGGSRPCAVYSFAGQAMDKKEASRLLAS